MKENLPVTLDLEVEEIESHARGGGSCTSSTTSLLGTCLCKAQTTSILFGASN